MSLIVPESFFVFNHPRSTKNTKNVLTIIPRKNIITIVLYSFFEICLVVPIIIGNKRRGNFILRTFNPVIKSLEIGSQNNSIKKTPEKIIGKYLWFFIFSHFNLKSNSKTQLINNPISDRLIGNFPKLTLAAKHEIKNTYSFLCVIFLSKKLIIS